MRITFDRLAIAAMPPSTMRLTSAFCNLVLPVVNGRRTFTIKKLSTTFEADLSETVSAQLTVTTKTVGTAIPKQRDSHMLLGPLAGAATVVSDFTEQPAFLECHPTLVDQMTATIVAQMAARTGLGESSGALRVAHIDIELAMRECPAT